MNPRVRRQSLGVQVLDTDTVTVEIVAPPTVVVGTAALGPAGPPGPSAVSTDAGNYARLGTDGLIWVAITVGPTAPATPFVGQLWVDTT